ncbi:MAG TPA: DUF2393 domain-containing protein [Campylobacterales bacterium]|nr:DUF2393 domain-containing protein [Campylobacterales bacterium]
MYFMTTLHWIVVAVFVLLFLILVLLSAKEKNVKTLLSMIFSSFLLTAAGAIFSLYALDKYTKKGKLISSSQKRDLSRESVIVRGEIRNEGNFKIGYCNVEVRISNDTTSRRGRTKSYFSPSTSFGSMFGAKDVKSNIFKEEYLVVENLDPKKSKTFTVSVPFPPHFANPRYRYKLFCH